MSEEEFEERNPMALGIRDILMASGVDYRGPEKTSEEAADEETFDEEQLLIAELEEQLDQQEHKIQELENELQEQEKRLRNERMRRASAEKLARQLEERIAAANTPNESPSVAPVPQDDWNAAQTQIAALQQWQQRARAILNNTAVLLYEAEMDAEAIEVMRKILKLDPDNQLVKENLALLMNE
jgi:tetratricopeptide (TPR) repeat protein